MTAATITNPACPCWSGYHFLHRPVCGCSTCERQPVADECDCADVYDAEGATNCVCTASD